MKIFYAVQATGNGHISRAMELLPYLERYGEVDIFLSGTNSSLALEGPVKFRSKGMSLFYTYKGTLDYRQMVRNISPLRMMQEVRDLPIEKYDLIINDFECITALACARKKVPSVNFGHQASFLSAHAPRPEKISKLGEWVLKNYAKATHHIGLHFQCYDDFIFSPVIKKKILHADALDKGHITVYLPSYCDEELSKILLSFKDHRFEIFSHQKKQPQTQGNLSFIPVSKERFNQSLISCHGIITGAGFETPAEALHLKKKLMVIPIRGQYEQLCNAAALQRLGIPVLKKIDEDFGRHFDDWINKSAVPAIAYEYSTEAIVDELIRRNLA